MAMPPRYKTGPKKGQFKSKSKRRKATKKTKRASRKLGAKPKRRRKPVAKKKKTRRRRRTAATTNLMTRAKIFGAGAAYGWAKEQKGYLANVPKVDAIGMDGTAMVAAHLYAKHGPRFGRKWADFLATALAGHNGVRFGLAGFQMSALQGMDYDDQDVVGALDPDDFLDEDLPEAAV